MNDNPTPVFRIEKRDGKYVPVEAQRIAKRGSWWHLRKKDGGILKLNGGGDWRETIYQAWSYAMMMKATHYALVCEGTFRGNRWDLQSDLESLFCDAMEDCYENGKLLGEIEGRREVKR